MTILIPVALDDDGSPDLTLLGLEPSSSSASDAEGSKPNGAVDWRAHNIAAGTAPWRHPAHPHTEKGMGPLVVDTHPRGVAPAATPANNNGPRPLTLDGWSAAEATGGHHA